MAGIGHFSAGNADENTKDIVNEITGLTDVQKVSLADILSTQQCLLVQQKLTNIYLAEFLGSELSEDDIK